jgi:hypothetical protein
MVDKDQGIEDGFGSAGLCGLISMIAVVWCDLFPKAYTLRDIVNKSAFAVRRSGFSQWLTEGGAREGVRKRRMT